MCGCSRLRGDLYTGLLQGATSNPTTTRALHFSASSNPCRRRRSNPARTEAWGRKDGASAPISWRMERGAVQTVVPTQSISHGWLSGWARSAKRDLSPTLKKKNVFKKKNGEGNNNMTEKEKLISHNEYSNQEITLSRISDSLATIAWQRTGYV